MKIENINILELHEYKKNAKKHDEIQINNVMQSIKEFGMVQPLVIDQNNTIIIGHCRFRALKRLKWEEVPCVRIENLSENEINKLRLLDNKLNESEWDFDLLSDQIVAIDWNNFDIDWGLDDFLKEDEKPEIIEDEAPDVEDTSITFNSVLTEDKVYDKNNENFASHGFSEQVVSEEEEGFVDVEEYDDEDVDAEYDSMDEE